MDPTAITTQLRQALVELPSSDTLADILADVSVLTGATLLGTDPRRVPLSAASLQHLGRAQALEAGNRWIDLMNPAAPQSVAQKYIEELTTLARDAPPDLQVSLSRRAWQAGAVFAIIYTGGVPSSRSATLMNGSVASFLLCLALEMVSANMVYRLARTYGGRLTTGVV